MLGVTKWQSLSDGTSFDFISDVSGVSRSEDFKTLKTLYYDQTIGRQSLG